MYLFSRRARLAPGNTRKAIEHVIGISEKVNQITGIGVSLYTQVFSPEVGTVAWTAFVPDLATLEVANDKLGADDGFASMIDSGAQYLLTGMLDDGLLQLVHGAPDPQQHIEYATTVQAVAAPGKYTRAIEVGVEIAQRAERATGTPTLFATSMTGVYGGVSWVTAFADVKAMEAGEAALAADASFAKFLDKEASEVYAAEPALTQQRIYRRMI